MHLNKEPSFTIFLYDSFEDSNTQLIVYIYSKWPLFSSGLLPVYFPSPHALYKLDHLISSISRKLVISSEDTTMDLFNTHLSTATCYILSIISKYRVFQEEY